MNRLSFFFLLCIFATAFATPIWDESYEIGDNEINGRIVGGTPANSESFPYQVSLQKNGRHFCGGSILNSKWILSAGHCFQELRGKTVVVGTHDLKTGGEKYKIKRIVVHPKFNMRKILNDLSLIEIEGSLTFSSKVKNISLPVYDINKANEQVIASGWGRIKLGGIVPTKLQYLVSKIYDHQKCKNFNSRVKDTNICTYTKRGEGMCHGDSGGPVVAGEFQVGIVSWGNPCANGYPDVHTRVFSYVDWIKSYINTQ